MNPTGPFSCPVLLGSFHKRGIGENIGPIGHKFRQRGAGNEAGATVLARQPEAVGGCVAYKTAMSFSWGVTIQYSLTPFSSRRPYLSFQSRTDVQGEATSNIRSGAPRQPRGSILSGSQISHTSGCVTV